MTSVSTDRRFGVNSGLAIKAPCKVATTANITLSGEQTIDGVSCAEDDRVLVRLQTTSSENGIYYVKSSAWERTPDFDDPKDVTEGTLVPVNQGSTYTEAVFRVDTTGTITPGTTSITFSISAFFTDGITFVSNVAQMRLLSPENLARYYLKGHTTEGSGFGVFRGVTGAVAGTYVDNNGTIIVPTGGDGSAAFLREYSDAVNIKWFGAAGDSVTDDTTAIQACIDSIGSLGGVVYIPCGTYKTTSSITISNHGITVLGEGVSSKILITNQTSNIFTVEKSGGSTEIRNIIFRDFSVMSTSVKSSGAAFACTKISRSSWENVFIGAQEDVTVYGNTLYSGITLNQFDYCRIDGGIIYTTQIGVSCNGDSLSLFGAQLVLTGGLRILNQTAVNGSGVLVGGGAGGVFFDCLDIIGNYWNVRIDTSLQPGVPNREIFFGSSASLDSALQSGIIVGADSCTHLMINGSWISSSGINNSLSSGIEVLSTNANLRIGIVGCRIFNNKGGGIYCAGGDVVISGCVIYGNGTGTGVTVANGYGNGIWITGTTGSAALTGNSVFANGYVTAGAGYGIKLLNTIPFFNVSGNFTITNIQGQLSYTGNLDNNRKIHNNSGAESKCPSFSAYASVAQAVGAAFVKIQIDTEEFDDTNNYDSVTNYRFTPNVAGYYYVTGSINVAAPGAHIASIYKNGSEFKRGDQPGTTTGTGVSSLIYLNGSTDYIELWGIFGGATNLTTGASMTYFQAKLSE